MINLLPKSHKEDIEYGRKNAEVMNWLTTIVFGITMLFLTALVGRITIQSTVAQAESTKSELIQKLSESSATKNEAEYTSFVNGVDNTKKLYSRQILYSRLVTKLATLLPEGSRLTSIALTDKDRAINLNFNNSVPGLAPTIQQNLENQGEQIASKTRSIFTDSLHIQLGGAPSTSNSSVPAVSVSPTDKQITFDIFIPGTEVGKAGLTRVQNSLKNGGELSLEIVSDILPETVTPKPTTPSTTPKLDEYKISTTEKRIDISFRANSVDELNDLKGAVLSAPNKPFIETYVFEDVDFLTSTTCKPQKNAQSQSCKVVCRDNSATCSQDQKMCVPLVARGCKYILRGYYDEPYITAEIAQIPEKDRKACAFECTHKVSATYSQMFSKVDINSVSGCSYDPAADKTSCQVAMRAEFGANSRYYFLNDPGAKK
jgi:predicted transcriptional regulator